MKLRHLESHLQGVEGFDNPKVHLEQYVTRPHIAACMLHTAESKYGDISESVLLDLGCGCGVLSIGSVLMGCDICYSVDIDPEALDIFRSNCEEMDIENVEMIQSCVSRVPMLFQKKRIVDTVIMNPPFGTKQNQGADMKFLEVASLLATKAVYSLHKSSTRDHVLKSAKKFGLDGTVVAELRYDLAASYKFHKAKSKDIAVDFIRFSVLKR